MQNGTKLFLFHTDVHLPNKMLCGCSTFGILYSLACFSSWEASNLFLEFQLTSPAVPSKLQAWHISKRISLRHQELNTFLQMFFLHSLSKAAYDTIFPVAQDRKRGIIYDYIQKLTEFFKILIHFNFFPLFNTFLLRPL